MKIKPMSSWPSVKRVADLTIAIWIQFTLKKIIYNVWVPGKEVKPIMLFLNVICAICCWISVFL